MDDQEIIQPQDPPLSVAADLIMTLWIILVSVAYFGAAIDPRLGHIAMLLSSAYAIMLLISVLSLALRFLAQKK
jgi:hypothetical protein